ncbi:hypothetical protein OR263_20440 [Streptomyces sp. NEAU-H22]|uniref:hypothetical protein n=1 Tax=Streptomyces sp. NEAU-H22 TaxID=2994655 RepID=UPI0022523BA6|nr:hypothetical protein [Streptomyces sp. NEAU-H22]MCX3289047.1 hypothetical protein [Streptomyces sp. NEAU-H22]
MPSRAGGPCGSRTGRGRTRAGGRGARATDGGAHATDSAAHVVGRGARAVGTGTRVLDRAGTGVGDAWAAGIPVASTPSSALRLHVPAPVP